MNPQLQFHKLKKTANDPAYGTQNSACFDLCACFEPGSPIDYFCKNNNPHRDIIIPDEENRFRFTVKPGNRVKIPTGLVFNIPENHFLKVYPRSGLSFKNGLSLSNGTGIIDQDYVEELFIIVINNSKVPYTIEHGSKIAQAELCAYSKVEFVPIQKKPTQKTDRNGGFGSTGV